jgi:hypothetical protein
MDAALVCESCGRAPARPITVRHHVGLVVLMQFFSKRVTACRPCGRRLVRSETLRTLWMGWWGPISFFFNLFVLGANWNAKRRLGAIEAPSLSGELVSEAPRGFDARPVEADLPAKRSRLRRAPAVVLLGLLGLGVVGWGWDATHHDHDGAHGVPVTVEELQLAVQGPWNAADGSVVTVAGAICGGQGEPGVGGYTHFDCSLSFDDGTGDEIVVHVLESGELFFVSSVGSTP